MFSLWTRYEMAFDGFLSLARTLGEGCRKFIPRLRFFFFFFLLLSGDQLAHINSTF